MEDLESIVNETIETITKGQETINNESINDLVVEGEIENAN